MSKVEAQQSQMTFQGLLEVCSMSEEDEAAAGVSMTRGELLQLSHRTRLWPLMEEVAVLNQLRLTADLLLLSLGPRLKAVFSPVRTISCGTRDDVFVLFLRDQDTEDRLRKEVSGHLAYCLQNTPMNVEQLRSLLFLLNGHRVSVHSADFIFSQVCK